nr:RNA-directed DNA polymerase, eukaryota, reverse transcriptase zinc-binding domain protein [Tanacetum cinerariifolium]
MYPKVILAGSDQMYQEVISTVAVTPYQKADLESMVTIKEVKRVVWDCGSDKAPGPDGYTFSFYRHFWSTIEKDVFATVQYFFNHDDIPKGCNSTFFTLILKISGANMVKDFRPISLIGSFYKIIAKVLTNRLVRVLGDIVNEVQSAFIANRQILDGPFIVNEVIQWCKKKKKHALIFKVDFEKAYDSVRWDYLDDVLDKFGFGIKWRGWIQNCLRSSRGLYTGIRLSSDVNLSHLFYVDDVMFAGQWSDSNIGTLVYVLKCFHQASGLKINIKIMGIHVNNEKVNDAAATLGCLTLKIPFVYLGTKVGDNMSRVEAWKDIMEKVLSRLSRWKLKTLSIGGRFTLLKSVLGSIPIFHMSIFKVPMSVLQRLESIRSHVFNGHELDCKKVSWVKWSKVCRFHSQSASLWTRVIKAIHGVDGGLDGGVEEDQYTALSDMMDSIVLTPKKDRFVWSLENSGDFSVKSIRKRIDDTRFIGGEIGTRWIKGVPIKVNIMA